jgi:polysaccharide biosynthesis protein PslG
VSERPTDAAPPARRAPRLPPRQPPTPGAVVALAGVARALRRDPGLARRVRATLLILGGICLALVAGVADARLHRGVESGAELPPVRQLTGRDLAANGDLTRFAPDQTAAVAAALQANGIRYLRQSFSWSDLEPRPGVFQWERADAIVDDLDRHGITLVAVLHRSPAWARAPGAESAFDAPPTDPGAYERFVQEFVTRYGAKAPFIQIWDLPNRPDHWGGKAATPSDYLGLLARGFNAARSANPNVSVVLAELDPFPGPGAPDDLTFLQGLYDAGGAPFFDVVAARLDGGNRTPYDRGVAAGAPSLSRATLLRDLLHANGDDLKPIWATHYGWRAAPPGQPGIGSRDQAAFAVAGIERARAEWPWMGPLFAWGLAPGPSLGGDVDPGEALLTSGGAPTPLLTALGAFAASGAVDVAPTGFLPVQARQIVYEGNWDLQHLGPATYRTTSQVGARLSVAFQGTGVVARLRLSRQAGALDVTLDGRPVDLDLDAFQAEDVDIPLAIGLADGPHQLTMRLAGPGQFTIGGVVVERAIPLRWPIVLLLGAGFIALAAGLREVAFALAERSGRLQPRAPGEAWPELPFLPEWRPSRRA